MQDMQDMIDRLNQSGKRLSKGHRKIAQYIVEHYDKAVFMTASKLGESVGVSESTVVRFASAMGYEGYPQLQRSLQELVRHRLTVTQRFEMSADINQKNVLPTVLKTDMQMTGLKTSKPESFRLEGSIYHPPRAGEAQPGNTLGRPGRIRDLLLKMLGSDHNAPIP